MRIVFMGAPKFAVPTMKKIIGDGHVVVAVYSRAPKPGGRRGLELRRTPVHEAAESLGISVFTPTTLSDTDAQRVFRGHAADVAVVVAYGLLLPVPILEAPTLGCVNLHASLLPRWRGAAPIQRAIMAGDPLTGVDFMRMNSGLDTGPVALRETIRIRPEDTAGDLTDRLAEIAANVAASGLRAMETGQLVFREQSSVGACYARKIDKSEAEIDWRRSAEEVRNHIHGLSPTPGAFSYLSTEDRQERIKVMRAKAVPASGAPGTILDGEMTVACRDGAIRILEAQQSGRNVMTGPEFIRSVKILAGSVFAPSAESSSAPEA
jgi:methionyl-tRNA formyltransferase